MRAMHCDGQSLEKEVGIKFGVKQVGVLCNLPHILQLRYPGTACRPAPDSGSASVEFCIFSLLETTKSRLISTITPQPNRTSTPCYHL